MAQSRLNQLTEHVYWLTPDERTDRPTLGAIIGENGTLIVDAGNSPAHATLLLDELAKLPQARPKYVVLTHWHWDHVFGTAAFDLPIIAHRETKRIVKEMSHLNWSDEALDKRVEAGVEIEFCRDMIKLELPDRTDLRLKAPDIAFTDQIEIDLGQVTCRVIHVGGDHAADSSVVYIPQDKVMFLSDCISPDLYYPQPRYTTQKTIPLFERLLSYDVDYYLLGHDMAPMSKADLREFGALLETVGRTVERLGDNRAAILADLEAVLSRSLDEDDLELVDYFLTGYGH